METQKQVKISGGRIGFFMLMSVMVLWGCNPEKNLSEQEKLLVANAWVMDSALVNGQVDSSDYSRFLLNFKANGGYEGVESDGSQSRGDWIFDEPAQTLTTIDGPTAALITYDVRTLSSTKLRLTFMFGGSELDWRMKPF